MTRFRIVPERSRVWIEASSSVHPIHGEADGLEGTIEAELAGGHLELSKKVQARLELAVDRISSGSPLYDAETHRRVEARRFPSIKGETRSVEEAGSGRYRVVGDLTFHGVTLTCDGEVTVSIANDRSLVVEGERAFDIRDFDVQPPRILMLKVHPIVKVRVRLEAKRED